MIALVNSLKGRVVISSLVAFEFRNSTDLQVFSFNHNRTHGMPEYEATPMLKNFSDDIASGTIRILTPDWSAVHHLATQLSAKHTLAHGHRSIDVLHVATALHCGAEHFLTLDDNQALLARAVGLNVQSDCLPTFDVPPTSTTRDFV
jgi:predicted nucleic acid-binding protein